MTENMRSKRREFKSRSATLSNVSVQSVDNVRTVSRHSFQSPSRKTKPRESWPILRSWSANRNTGVVRASNPNNDDSKSIGMKSQVSIATKTAIHFLSKTLQGGVMSCAQPPISPQRGNQRKNKNSPPVDHVVIKLESRVSDLDSDERHYQRKKYRFVSPKPVVYKPTQTMDTSIYIKPTQTIDQSSPYDEGEMKHSSFEVSGLSSPNTSVHKIESDVGSKCCWDGLLTPQGQKKRETIFCSEDDVYHEKNHGTPETANSTQVSKYTSSILNMPSLLESSQSEDSDVPFLDLSQKKHVFVTPAKGFPVQMRREKLTIKCDEESTTFRGTMNPEAICVTPDSSTSFSDSRSQSDDTFIDMELGISPTSSKRIHELDRVRSRLEELKNKRAITRPGQNVDDQDDLNPISRIKMIQGPKMILPDKPSHSYTDPKADQEHVRMIEKDLEKSKVHITKLQQEVQALHNLYGTKIHRETQARRQEAQLRVAVEKMLKTEVLNSRKLSNRADKLYSDVKSLSDNLRITKARLMFQTRKRQDTEALITKRRLFEQESRALISLGKFSESLVVLLRNQLDHSTKVMKEATDQWDIVITTKSKLTKKHRHLRKKCQHMLTQMRV
eukprot:scaffold55415_cov52-Attheya_sp.AAC.1